MTNAKIIPLASISEEKREKIQQMSATPKMYLSIENSRFDSKLNCTIYIIEVGILVDQDVYIHQVHKRYSALNQFDDLIRPVFYNAHELQSFPPKKIFGNKSSTFIEQRSQALQNYLQSLLKVPGMIETITFNRFFEINHHLISND